MRALLKAFPFLLALFACPAAAQEHQWQAPNSEELIQHNKPIYKTEEKDVLDQINTDVQQRKSNVEEDSCGLLQAIWLVPHFPRLLGTPLSKND